MFESCVLDSGRVVVFLGGVFLQLCRPGTWVVLFFSKVVFFFQVYWLSGAALTLLSFRLPNAAGMGLLATSVHYNGIPNVALTEAVIASPNSGGMMLRPGVSPNQPQFQCIITLDDIYLLNSITFQSYPEVQGVDPLSLGYSYTFEFSKDGRQWTKLFDYSGFNCYGANTLNFPVLATK